MPKTNFCRGDGHCCQRPSSNWEAGGEYEGYYI